METIALMVAAVLVGLLVVRRWRQGEQAEDDARRAVDAELWLMRQGREARARRDRR